MLGRPADTHAPPPRIARTFDHRGDGSPAGARRGVAAGHAAGRDRIRPVPTAATGAARRRPVPPLRRTGRAPPPERRVGAARARPTAGRLVALLHEAGGRERDQVRTPGVSTRRSSSPRPATTIWPVVPPGGGRCPRRARRRRGPATTSRASSARGAPGGAGAYDDRPGVTGRALGSLPLGEVAPPGPSPGGLTDRQEPVLGDRARDRGVVVLAVGDPVQRADVVRERNGATAKVVPPPWRARPELHRAPVGTGLVPSDPPGASGGCVPTGELRTSGCTQPARRCANQAASAIRARTTGPSPTDEPRRGSAASRSASAGRRWWVPAVTAAAARRSSRRGAGRRPRRPAGTARPRGARP